MAQSITTQAQAIITQANREVAPRENQHASTIASRLRDFTRMNPPMYFGSKVDEDPQDFLDEFYKIMFAMGVSTIERAELAAYNLKDVAQTWFMVHAQQVEESYLRKRNWEATKVPSNFSKIRIDRGSNPKPQKGRIVDPPRERPTCGKSGKRHEGESLVGTKRCYGCGKGSHMLNDFPNVRGQGRENIHAQPSGLNSEAPKRNYFYALKARGKQKTSPDVVTGKLPVFFVNVYAFLDPGSTLSFVTPLVATKFDVLPNVLIEPFPVCTTMVDSVVAKRVMGNVL
ncbi:uncharacterized protein LOC107030088 [Solanum pennellii]|uniref:Uncharacterized protein LOC107030088 n=1 Tax=Solanum pennellii TaxID=28526 RepID=A0ABM1HKX3_SOLPN|nr:uncharacterized protein LOC107030088 [Solanum pennellii]